MASTTPTAAPARTHRVARAVPVQQLDRSGAAGVAIIADASKVSGAEFYGAVRSIFAPAPTRLSERSDAAQRFMGQAWGKPRAEVERLRAVFDAELAEIDARYDAKAAHEAAMKAEIRL